MKRIRKILWALIDATYGYEMRVRYFRKVNRVTSRNGAGASTWDIQFLYNPQFERIVPVFGASRKF